MALDLRVEWSELAIEKGKLDPLSLWRVNDRLISELLSPFTTILTHRPARYFSMFTWIIYYLNNQDFSDRKTFWNRFYEIEAVLVCAILKHKQHSYDYFSGLIGSESATKIVSNAQNDILKFSRKRISNGWDHNYKNPMYDFKLVETDYGFVSGLRVTEKGKKLALAYQDSIGDSKFFKDYLNESMIPIKVLEELAEYSCPCLVFNPENDLLKREQKISIECFLRNDKTDSKDESDLKLKSILSSMKLILHFMGFLGKENVLFTRQVWRRVLSTHFTGSSIYIIPEEFSETFRKWELYNLESLYVYSLESGLSGFLEHLQKQDNTYESALIKPIEQFYDDMDSQVELVDNIKIRSSINQFIANILKLNPEHLFDLENRLVNEIEISNSIRKIFYSFILCLYAQSLYLKKNNDPSYISAVKFYLDKADIDGMELSLNQSVKELSSHSIKDYILNIYLRKWIIQRQQYTRDKRNKDVAWFSINRETKTYNWESDYNPGLYRAARCEILMTFLLNMGIVHHTQEGWSLK